MDDTHQIRVSGQTLTGTQVAGVDSLIEVKIKGGVCTRRPRPRRRGPSSTFPWTREAEQRRAQVGESLPTAIDRTSTTTSRARHSGAPRPGEGAHGRACRVRDGPARGPFAARRRRAGHARPSAEHDRELC